MHQEKEVYAVLNNAANRTLTPKEIEWLKSCFGDLIRQLNLERSKNEPFPAHTLNEIKK